MSYSYYSQAKQNMASTLILFGALIWSAPVATVQALATTEQLAKVRADIL